VRVTRTCPSRTLAYRALFGSYNYQSAPSHPLSSHLPFVTLYVCSYVHAFCIREVCCTDAMVTAYMDTVQRAIAEVLGPNYLPSQLWNSDEKPLNPALEAARGTRGGTFMGPRGESAPVVVTDPDKAFMTGGCLPLPPPGPPPFYSHTSKTFLPLSYHTPCST
jgi:hypothetical protein